MPEVSVVVGTYQRRRHLQAAVASVRDELQDVDHEIIVVDGGSTDGTRRWLIEQKDVISIVQHNRGQVHGRPVPRRPWGYFMNIGFRAASAPVLCMLSDDCVVLPGAIRNGLADLQERLQRGEAIGGIAFWWRDWPVEHDYRVGVTFGNNVFVNHGLFSRSALADVGYVDAAGFSFYHADGDLALRMAQLGFPCVAATNSFVEHYVDANERVRASNRVTQRADWETYTTRWEHLGAPRVDWLRRSTDEHDEVARRYWGKALTSTSVRIVKKALSRVAVALQ